MEQPKRKEKLKSIKETGKPNILYIDDDTDNLTSFKYQFQDYYNILLAGSGEEGFELLKNHNIPVVIADQRMPNMSGTQFFEKIIPDFPQTKRMILTGYSDIQAVIDAINKGQVYYYLQKPWNEQEVLLIIKNALESLEFEKKNEELIKNLRESNDRLEKHKEELKIRIEERKRAEERFRDLFENNPVSIWEEDFSLVKQRLYESKPNDVYDVVKYLDDNPALVEECLKLIKVIDINQATLRTHGAKEKSELLNNVEKFFNSKSCGMFKKEFAAILSGDIEVKEDAKIRTLDGRDRYVTIAWSVPPGYENSYARVLVSIFDITERVVAEKALRESEERFRSLYENATVGIYQTTPDGEIIIANPAIIAMLGYKSFEELKNMGNVISGYIEKDAREVFKEIIEREGVIYGYEELWYKKDGTKIYVLESARAVKDDKGETKYYEGIIEDITERKAFENALIEARNRAEESDRLKSEFLAQMSHEIRTPLNVILNFTELLKDDIQNKINSEISESFDYIENAGRRIIRTVDLILNMSDVQIGSFKANFSRFDLYSEILLKLEHEFKPYADSKNILLNISADTTETVINADNYSINQIFINLVDNAIKYTDKGGVDIVTSKGPNNELIVSVIDTGIGISDEFLPHLYEPFSQEEHGYTRKYDGTGLGLALVKKYCEINNAELCVTSKKGTGTTFTVTFIPNNE